MDKNSNSFVMAFAVGMCVVLAVILAGAFADLSPDISANQAFDKNINVMIATGLYDPAGEAKSRVELEEMYEKYIDAKVLKVTRAKVEEAVREDGVDKQVEVEKVTGMEDAGFPIEELPMKQLQERRKLNKADREEFATFYTRVDDDGNPVAYCIPVDGLGLWGMIYGFLALESDLNTVRGITFFKHKETPGLGGEIDKTWWRSQWPGKTIRDSNGNLVSVTVKKGQVDDSIAFEKAHYVDGLSGATITSNGVTNFIRTDLTKYWPYFANLR